MKHEEALSVEAASLGVDLSAEQLERLLAFERLLIQRAIPLGFISEGDRPVVRERHVLDCLRAAPLLPAGRIADLGSGAGLPGVVVAIARPDDVTVELIEPKRRRLAFLELAVERLHLSNALPVGTRAERLPAGYDAALARAFADVRASWAIAGRLLSPGAPLVYFAGRRFAPRDVTGLALTVDVHPPPALLESSGPLVIMSRQ